MLDIQKAHSYTRRNSCLTDLLAGVVRHPQIRLSGGMSMCLSKLCLRSLFLLAFLLAVSYAASAQYRAGIQGTVLDPQGAVIDGAKVTVTANETGLSQETTTDDKGVYSVNRLAPGLYTITVEKGGFKKESLESVNIIGDQVTSVNETLQLGQVAESVTDHADNSRPSLRPDEMFFNCCSLRLGRSGMVPAMQVAIALVCLPRNKRAAE